MAGSSEIPGRPGWKRGFFKRAGHYPEEERRRVLALIFLVPGIPTLVFFSLHHYFSLNFSLCILLLGFAAALAASLVSLKFLRRPVYAYRTITAFFAATLLIIMISGGAEDSRILWTFTFSFVPFFFLGREEGVVWNLVVYLLFLAVMWIPGVAVGGAALSLLLKVRFLLAYGIILLINTTAHLIVQRYAEELKRDKSRLQDEIEERRRAEDALKEVKEELERRVDERTADLTEAAQDLRNQVEERKKVERDLRESEEMYRSILETAPDSITITSLADGRYRQVNEAFCRLSGYSRKEVLGKTPFDLNLFVNESDRDSFIQILQDTGEVRNFEVQYRIKDGTILDTLFSARPITYEGEKCLVSVVSDITVRKSAEEALRESEEKYRLLVDNANEAIFIAQDGIVKFPNPKTLEMVEYSRRQLEAMPFINLVHPDDREMVLRRHRKRLMGVSLPSIYNFRILNRRKQEIWVQLNTVLITWDGRPATLNFLSDVTQLKELELQLQQAQKIQSIGTIASGVAHNFRNVLAGISLNNQLIETRYEGDPDLIKVTTRIGNSVKKGAELVEGLMQFSRKEVRRHFEPVNLVDVIWETVDLVTHSFDKKIEIEAQLPEELWMRGDQSALSQVMMNLLTNSRDAMPEGGKINIQGRVDKENIVVVVEDTGLGMEREALEQCFDPFFTTKGIDGGTGLGLSTTYGIVLEHEGDIRVRSSPGRGTRFRIVFPLFTGVLQEERAASHESTAGKGQKVLIVDDEIELLRPLEELLKGLGYKVASSKSGKDAVGKYASWRPDAVLMDRNMPDMDGITCTRKIMEQDPHARIILISGYDEEGPHGIDSDTAGAISGYATKPVDLEELSRLLAGIFS